MNMDITVIRVEREQWLKERLEKIKEALKTRSSDDAYRDQEFAKAYQESGLSQEEIAKVHGCSRVTICCRLRFGSFLEWLVTSGNTLPLKRLTERRFRRYWEQTSGLGEEPRFKRVLESLLNPWRPNDVARRIVESVRKGRGGQWFTPEEMAEQHGIPLPIKMLFKIDTTKKGFSDISA